MAIMSVAVIGAGIGNMINAGSTDTESTPSAPTPPSSSISLAQSLNNECVSSWIDSIASIIGRVLLSSSTGDIDDSIAHYFAEQLTTAILNDSSVFESSIKYARAAERRSSTKTKKNNSKSKSKLKGKNNNNKGDSADNTNKGVPLVLSTSFISSVLHSSLIDYAIVDNDEGVLSLSSRLCDLLTMVFIPSSITECIEIRMEAIDEKEMEELAEQIEEMEMKNNDDEDEKKTRRKKETDDDTDDDKNEDDDDDDDDDGDYLGDGDCAICEREMPLTRHHLIPKQTHRRFIKRGWTNRELNHHIALICRPCHSAIHKLYDNDTLADHYHTIELLLSNEKVIKWAKYASKLRINRTKTQMKQGINLRYGR